MTEPDQDEAVRDALRALAQQSPGAARSRLGAWYRVAENADLIRQLRARRTTWHAISAELVKFGLIPTSPRFAEDGPDGDKERERVAVLAKRSWFRVEGSAPRNPVVGLSPAPAPRVRPVEAPSPAAPATDDPVLDPAAMLARLGNTMNQRSGKRTPS